MSKPRTKPNPRTRAGESMVMVVVLLMVFFILGASVLTAASAASAASSARMIERQSYYYARSMLDVLDEALQSGVLGRSLCTVALDRLVLDGGDSVTFTDEVLLTLTPSFDGDLLAEAEVGEITLTGSGRAAAVTGAGEQLTAASVQFRRLTMAFTVTHKGVTTHMQVVYWCQCNVTGYNAANKTGTWSNTWRIQRVG